MERLTRLISSVLTHAVLVIFGAMVLFPIFWIFSSALKPLNEIFVSPPRLLPDQPTLTSIITLFEKHSFARVLLNTVISSIGVTAGALLLHSMAAYSLARLKFPGRNLIFLGIVSTMLIPIYGILVPRFLVVKSLGWFDSFAGLIIPAIPHAFGIFALRQFFISIPKELEEAAIIDGASRVRIFFTIILPLSKNILITLGVLFYIATWDSFIWPLIITSSSEMQVVQVALARFRSDYLTEWDMILAGSAIGILPNLIIFFILQKYVTRGVQTTGLKL